MEDIVHPQRVEEFRRGVNTFQTLFHFGTLPILGARATPRRFVTRHFAMLAIATHALQLLFDSFGALVVSAGVQIMDFTFHTFHLSTLCDFTCFRARLTPRRVDRWAPRRRLPRAAQLLHHFFGALVLALFS